ncbi:hypothetical protein [Brevundimonas sp. FT23028]|uniref:hypothetical protein n=1 Tax=Brevundimonas sp. FT23028 TaxID=3393748 RepID=UPI003B587E38
MNKSVASSLALAGLFLGAGLAPADPALAQTNLTGRALAEVCLPYANRTRSFERAIRAARDLDFRRPADQRGQPIEEYASEIELVSRDGVWRIRLEEGSIEHGDTEVYAVSCSLSSTRASATELGALGRRAFNNDRYWSTEEGAPRQWERLGRNPEERRLQVEVLNSPGERPALRIRGLYF